MPVGTVEFYSMPGSISSGEYPIFTSNQDVSGYLVESVEKCKYTKDLLQAVGPIAIFDDYDTVNMARINDEWYWVVDWTTQSLQKESVIFGLSYNAPTSNLRLGQSLTGVFNKTPTLTRSYMSATISNDAMKENRHIDLPNMGTYSSNPNVTVSNNKLYWVELVTTGYGTETSKVCKFGLFALFDMVNLQPSTSHVFGDYDSDSNRTYRYPTINDVISDPESIYPDLLADQIIQISISERCPFNVIETIHHRVGTQSDIRGLKIQNGTLVRHGSNMVTIDMTNQIPTPKTADTLTLNLTEMERSIGSVRVINESGTAIATIPTQYGASIPLSIQSISDYTGIYTELSYNGRVVCQWSEGHLPWIGDAWLQYQARQLEYDRTMTSIANTQARSDLDISLRQSEMNQTFSQINAVSNVSIFSPLSAVGAVLSITESHYKGEAERSAMRQRTMWETLGNTIKQQLTEKMMKAEPGTAYSMGYGTIYGLNTIKHPANIRLEMPSNMTSTYYNDFMSEYGYPSEGKQTLVLSAGYIQGQIINNGTITGAKFDELSRTLQNGIKMRTIT